MKATRNDARIRSDCEKLADIFTILQRNFIWKLSEELSRGKVSYPQYFLLGFLTQENALTMSEIAAKMGHTTAAATGLVDRLENLRYVKRNHAAEDRRKIEVRITSKGKSLVSYIRRDMVDNLVKLMHHLRADEQEAWVQIYEKIFPLCRDK